MLRSLVSRRSLWAGLAVVSVLAVSLSFAPVRIWAGQFLGLFRVQQIELLPLDTAVLGNLSNDQTVMDQISRFFADSVTVRREPGDPQPVASAAEASQAAGFTVRLPTTGGDPALSVVTGPAFDVVVDRDRAQAVIDEAGRSDLQLPASLDGASISVDLPTGVAAAYGDCPTGNAMEAMDPGEPERAAYRQCIVLAQMPSPAVDIPPDLNLGELAELGLQFAGMSPAEAHEFSQTVDWTTTLVVPIPRQAAIVEQVSVDGVTGQLLLENSNRSHVQGYALLWAKDGIIYTISGFGAASDALALANSME